MEKGKDNRFDIALNKEIEHEQAVTDFLHELGKSLVGQSDAIEIKHDYQTVETGNVFIEFESRGKKSGILTTKSDWYIFKIDPILLIAPTSWITTFMESYRIVSGGDDYTSNGYLVPIKDFFNYLNPNPKPMSNYTPQPNTFSLFANDKGDNPKRPDYKGDIIMPDGTKMRLSAWIRESSNGGRKFLSGKVEPIQDQQQSAPSPQKDGDDLPF
jgi:hypothetical protein